MSELLSKRWRQLAAALLRGRPGHVDRGIMPVRECARLLIKCADEYDENEKPDWHAELLSALGWQRGTIHGALEAVRRLVAAKDQEDR